MAAALRPATEAETVEAVRWALAAGEPLELVGLGSKAGLGRPVQASHRLQLSGLYGIALYEPAELVLSAAAGTPLAEIESALAEQRQQLAFEPPDLGPLLGAEPGGGTIGGALACNLSGPRRPKAGAARDHFLGFRAVSGRGEAFKAGGRVVKNVTGYDLMKLMAGSYGTLAILTEVTLKVLPAPETTRTLLLHGLADVEAVRAMTHALRSPHEVSGAAHLPADLAALSKAAAVARAGAAITALRLEGPGPSVERRAATLRQELAAFGADAEPMAGAESGLFWREVRDALLLLRATARAVPAPVIWRLSIPPAAGAAAVTEIRDGLTECRHFYDWGGGLVWLALPPAPDAGAGPVRAAAARASGHATLMRAPADLRIAVPVFEPEPPPLAALARRVKESFDPQRILNPGRMAASL